MKTASYLIISVSILISISCHTSKKSIPSTTSSHSPIITNDYSPSLLLPIANSDIQMPSNEELLAIQTQYKDATMNLLKNGHTIYTKGACINCHEAKSIYTYKETEWKAIIEDMAQKADISNTE